MRPDWEVKTSSQAVKFLNRVFRHQFQREVSYAVMNPTLQIIIDAQGACLSAMYAEAA
jgi:hypothetical protein